MAVSSSSEVPPRVKRFILYSSGWNGICLRSRKSPCWAINSFFWTSPPFISGSLWVHNIIFLIAAATWQLGELCGDNSAEIESLNQVAKIDKNKISNPDILSPGELNVPDGPRTPTRRLYDGLSRAGVWFNSWPSQINEDFSTRAEFQLSLSASSPSKVP